MLKERQRRNRTTQERWSPTDQIWDNLAIEILLSNGSELSKIQSRALMIEINEYIHKWRERTSSFLQENANWNTDRMMQLENHQGFPSGAVVDNLPANAGDKFSSCSGKIPRAAEQVSPCATTIKPVLRAWELQLLKSLCPSACAPKREKPPQWEARTPHLESSPCSPQLEKRPAQQQRPSTVINKQIKLFLKFTEREVLNKGSNVPCYCICKINASPIKLLKSRVEDHAILTSTLRCQSALYGAIRL